MHAQVIDDDLSPKRTRGATGRKDIRSRMDARI